MPILLLDEIKTAVSLILEIVESNQEALFLDLFDGNQDMMALAYFHALGVDHILICEILLVETKFQFLQTCQVVENENEGARFGRLLDLESHVGGGADPMDTTVDFFESFVKGGDFVLGLRSYGSAEFILVGLRRLLIFWLES